MPVALRVLQLFELMPPVSGTLDYADIEFYINGDHLVMERLYMECPTLQLLGEGEMLIPSLELDLRLRTRGTLPIFRDLVAAVSNTLFEVEVTGSLTAPKAKLVTRPSGSISLACFIMTARASWCPRNLASKPPRNSPALRSAPTPERRRN